MTRISDKCKSVKYLVRSMNDGSLAINVAYNTIQFIFWFIKVNNGKFKYNLCYIETDIKVICFRVATLNPSWYSNRRQMNSYICHRA